MKKFFLFILLILSFKCFADEDIFKVDYKDRLIGLEKTEPIQKKEDDIICIFPYFTFVGNFDGYHKIVPYQQRIIERITKNELKILKNNNPKLMERIKKLNRERILERTPWSYLTEEMDELDELKRDIYGLKVNIENPYIGYKTTFQPKTKNLKDLQEMLYEFYENNASLQQLDDMFKDWEQKGTAVNATDFYVEVLEIIDTKYHIPILKVRINKEYNEYLKNNMPNGLKYDEIFYVLATNVISFYEKDGFPE